jgi:hypothetical protein
MRIRLLASAILAASALLLPQQPQAQASPPDARAAYHVVDRLLARRGALALTEHQVRELTALSQRLHHPRVGFDGVPGKAAVPRITYQRATAHDARRMALQVLTPAQQREATAILDAPDSTQTAAH